MFNFVFGVLAIWFIINVIWMWFKLDDQRLQKTFAWINVCAIVLGFWTYYCVAHDTGGVEGWFIVMNWFNVVIAAVQFYFGYRGMVGGHNAHHFAR
ncbi:hypothetical protein [Limosilactobacillus sp.]|uniref:hypothetical protein n=1 Tax=Limosilactobacillus sp. TaxID=2773925 RepID=UPI003F06102B